MKIKNSVEDYSKIAFLGISSVTYAILILFAFKLISDSISSEKIYYLTLMQQISAIFVIFLFYGINFEKSLKKKTYRVAPVVIFIILLSFVNIYLGILIGMLLRVGISKFTLYTKKRNYINIAIIILFLLYLFFENEIDGLNVVLAAILISFGVQNIFGHQTFEIFDTSEIRFRHCLSGLIRSSLDYAILVPPIVINVLYYRFGSTENYIELQRLFYALAGSSILIALIERVTFDRSRKGNELEPILIKELLILGVILSIISSIAAIYIGLDSSNLFFLVYSSFYGVLFGSVLSKARSYISYKEAAVIATIQLLFFFTFVGLMFILGSSSLKLLLTVNCIFSFFQVFPLVYYLNKYKIKFSL